MINFLKKYWDLVGGVIAGVALAFIADFNLETVQLYYSIIILVLVCIGLLKVLKQALDKHYKKRKHSLIDNIVDGQRPVKAISLAQEPTKDGEKIGYLLLELSRGGKKVMKKFKEFLDKFKGYMLTIALAILTLIEMCGGYINDLFGDALTVRGVEILPVITLGATAIVGILSNGFTKEQMEKIKALFSKSTTNELVLVEIKKSIKDNELKLKDANKLLATKETELENLKSQLENARNTHEAKIAMYHMKPQLATDKDVQEAATNVVNLEAAIVEKQNEIDKEQKYISNLLTTINALKNQL